MANLKLFIASLLKRLKPSLGKPKYIEFICQSCQAKEKIPTHVVYEMDFNDEDGDLLYPPRFSCESCQNGQMYPLFYKSFRGTTYRYNPKTKKFSSK